MEPKTGRFMVGVHFCEQIRNALTGACPLTPPFRAESFTDSLPCAKFLLFGASFFLYLQAPFYYIRPIITGTQPERALGGLFNSGLA